MYAIAADPLDTAHEHFPAYPIAWLFHSMGWGSCFKLEMPAIPTQHDGHRYGYGERVQQDESFADLILQRVAMLQYSSLLDLISKSTELQCKIPDLVPSYGGSI